jgi:ATP-dependent DNA helicase RecG
MQRRWSRALQRVPADLPIRCRRTFAAARLPSRYARCSRRISRRDAPLDALNRFRDAGAARLIFEEAFLFQMGVSRGAVARRERTKPIRVDDRIRESARAVLPFKLTNGQKQALKEIVDDMQRPQPMNRLLQGDVGAGKTIVALLAALVAMENGLQVAFMAPTEILAEQHF